MVLTHICRPVKSDHGLEIERHSIISIAFPERDVRMAAFAALGVGMLLSPLWAWWKTRHTAYVITDKRLVTATADRRSAAIRNVMPDQLLSIERKQSRNRHGSGSIKIVTGNEKDSDGDRVLLTEHLTGVADVAQAERLLQALRVGHGPQ